jgi:hypothetical protein
MEIDTFFYVTGACDYVTDACDYAAGACIYDTLSSYTYVLSVVVINDRVVRAGMQTHFWLTIL